MTLLGQSSDEGVIALQSLAELHGLLIRKAALTPASAHEVIRTLAGAFETQPTDEATLAGALELSNRHRLQIFDAIILSVAAQAGCEILYSEDMQHGFAWNGVRIVNPFLAKTTGA